LTADGLSLIITHQLAKDTLSEVGVSARPFVPCREEFVQFKEAYYDMLVVAQPLVRHVHDGDTRREFEIFIALPLLAGSSETGSGSLGAEQNWI
jgi:hypothetical protein